MKVVLWLGNESNQKGLAHKIAAVTEVAGIVIETRVLKQKWTIGLLIKKIIGRLFFIQISNAWSGMKAFYAKRYSEFPKTPTLEIANINNEDVAKFTSNLKPDLVIVSGTSLIKKKLLSINLPIGIMNLHTGISPYIKGGPNCTNWCLASGQFHLIGNTIMWIDAGIDTGKIITTELTPLTGDESLTDLHIKVMEHAHDLYVRSIIKSAHAKIEGVRQAEIVEGKTYFTRDWDLATQMNLLRNFRKFKTVLKSDEIIKERNNLKLIKL